VQEGRQDDRAPRPLDAELVPDLLEHFVELGDGAGPQVHQRVRFAAHDVGSDRLRMAVENLPDDLWRERVPAGRSTNASVLPATSGFRTAEKPTTAPLRHSRSVRRFTADAESPTRFPITA
jgi:hypothetical protein